MRGPGKTAAQTPGPRIAFLDIETAPLRSYHWGLWDQNIGLEMIDVEWSILSFSWNWLGEDKCYFEYTGGRGVDKIRDDRHVLQALWKLLDETDVIVVQNGKAFDLKKINARMLALGMGPYSPVKIVDTKIVAKKHFAFTSNKLEWMSQHLTKVPKSKHKEFPGFELWEECLKDNPRAWKVMERYNKRDIISLKALYLVMRPWIEGHPNLAVYHDSEDIHCPKCDSTNVQARGSSYTQTGKYHRFQCKDCGGWARSRFTLNSKGKRHALLSN